MLMMKKRREKHLGMPKKKARSRQSQSTTILRESQKQAFKWKLQETRPRGHWLRKKEVRMKSNLLPARKMRTQLPSKISKSRAMPSQARLPRLITTTVRKMQHTKLH